jgi:hypothetical protein
MNAPTYRVGDAEGGSPAGKSRSSQLTRDAGCRGPSSVPRRGRVHVSHAYGASSVGSRVAAWLPVPAGRGGSGTISTSPLSIARWNCHCTSRGEPLAPIRSQICASNHHDNEDLRRLILELQRARDRFIEIEQYYEAIQRVWKDDVGGQLVVHEKLRRLLQEERWRWGGML